MNDTCTPGIRNIAELPDNKEQAMKRLESTERRLLKNPDEAAAYNHKIIEMEEMNIASKLTQKEIEDQKGLCNESTTLTA